MSEDEIAKLTNNLCKKINKKISKKLIKIEFPLNRCITMNLLNILISKQSIIMTKELSLDVDKFIRDAVFNPIQRHIDLYKEELCKPKN